MDAAAMAENTSRPNKALHLRLRSGTQKKNSTASVAPPPRVKICCFGWWSAAVDAGVVLIVSVDVTDSVPEMAGGAVAEQVGASTAPDGPAVTAQVSATLPVNPPLGVNVMVEVPLLLGDKMLTGGPLSVKVEANVVPVTLSGTLIDSATPPELPVTVAVYAPWLVADCVLKVSVAVTGVVPEIAAGVVGVQLGTSTAPDIVGATAHVSTTLPVKPPLGVIVTVEVVELSCVTTAVGVALNENAAPVDEGRIT
jgi:hypothetical protein